MPNLYETLLIVTPEGDDETINAVIGDLRSVVDEDQGTMLQARIWERNRKLAYQVQGKTEGHYVILHSEGSGNLPQALKAKMKLDESVIRSIVVRLEGAHEAAVRQEIGEIEGDPTAAIAEQMAAAERRAAARARAATRTTAEIAAEQEALEAERAAAAAASAPAIVGEDSSTSAPMEDTPATDEDPGAAPDALSSEEKIEAEDAPASEAATSPDEPAPAEATTEEAAPQTDAVADEEEKES
jgi:small subunit ribosomal protein S6